MSLRRWTRMHVALLALLAWHAGKGIMLTSHSKIFSFPDARLRRCCLASILVMMAL